MARLTRHVLRVTLFSLLIMAGGHGSASAQQTLAAIVTADLPRYQQAHQAFVKVLQSGGFGEDKLKIFKQTPNADKMSLANSLRRAEAAGVALVVTYGSSATSAAMTELRETPLLFVDVYDPVELGVVKTLAAPGADASGATSKTELSLLVESLNAMKAVTKVGALYSKGEKGSEQQLAQLKEQGKASGFEVAAENVRNPKEAVKLAVKLASSNQALFVTESTAASQKLQEIITAALEKNCPTISQTPGAAAAGALVSLEADPEEQGKLAAVHALQFLQGQKLHILPVRQARKIDLMINQKTAQQLGLTIPPTVASKAKVL